MFNWIVETSLRMRVLILGIAIALVVFGVTRLQEMPISVFPEFAAPVVEVQTEALGLSAEEVESLITLNLEELLSGVPWLESVRSKSVTGLSSIVLTFKRGTDLYEARQMVQERLTLAYALPNVSSTPAIIQPVATANRIMMVGITSDEIEETQLSLLARWTILPKLVGIPGVSNVAIWGQRLREMQVHIDPERLREARLTQADIIQAAGDSLWITPLSFLRGSSPGTGGFIDNQNQRLGVHHKMPIVHPEDMAKVAVTPQHLLMTGKNMTLGEVAEITFSHPALIGDAFVDGGTGLILVIEKFPATDTLEVTRDVEKALAELKRGLPGVNINATVFQLATYIEASVSNLADAVIFGAVLLILVLGAFLYNWRGALVSLSAVTASLLAAIFVLSLTGETLNLMILAGLVLALAVLIDDAVVDIEDIMGRLREREDGGPSVATIIYETTVETGSAAIYAVLIVLLAVMPIFFLGGIAGAFYEPLALSYVLAVVVSLVVGLTVTPALSFALFAKSPSKPNQARAVEWFRGRYHGLLEKVLHAPRNAFIAGGALILAGVLLWPMLGQSLLPALKEPEVLVNLNTPPGTSHAETFRITSRISRELETLPGVRQANAHIGRAITGDQIVEIHAGQIWVGLDADADFEEMLNAVRETVGGYPGIDFGVNSYLRNTVSQVLTGADRPIVIRIFGKNRDTLRRTADDVIQKLADIEGLVDPRAIGQTEQPQVKVRVDLDAASKAAVKPGEVRRSAATVFSGLNVGYLFEDQKIYDVVVWSAPESRNSVTDLENVPVEKSDRHHVRLGKVAKVNIESVPTVIRHSGASPFIDVVADVEGRDVGSVTRDVEQRLDTVQFPLEYYPELMGEYIERRVAQERILGVGLTAVIGIFLLLQACFGSWRLATIGFLALPASAAGGVLAVLATGGVVSMGSIVGFLAVLGIAARNAVLLINHYQHLEVKEAVPFGTELILRGTYERLPAILTSTAAIIAALLPLVVFGQIPGLELVQPTAVVILGGLIAATLLTLFVMPALYLIVGARAERRGDIRLADM